MAVGADNFDSYSVGALAGNNGGSGWGGAWTDGGNDNWQVENTVFQSSPNGVSATSSATDRFIFRTYASAQATGTQGFYARLSATTGELDFQLNSGTGSIGNTNVCCFLRFDSSSNIVIFGPAFGSTVTVMAGYSANTFYQIDLDFDGGAQTYRARVNGGAYSSTIGFVNTHSTVDRVVLHNSNNTTGVTQWYDTLYDTNASGGGPSRLPYLNLLGVGT